MKRYEKFNYNSVAKKQKTESEDEWGEDLEFEEVDKCLTQLETQNNNTLANYETFKNKANIFSTQAFLVPNVPSTSKYFPFETQNNSTQISAITLIKDGTSNDYPKKLVDDIKKLEEYNKILTEQYKTKDGEISILRMQLKQAQKQADIEKMQRMQHIEKSQQQWNQKYNTIVKEKDNMKNDLDLKHLEIVNLREKLRDLKFQNSNLNDVTIKDFNLSQSRNKRFCPPTLLRNGKAQTENSKNILIPPTSQLCFPLPSIIPQHFFDNKKHEHCEIIKLHSSTDNGALLRPNSTQYGNVIDFQSTEVNKTLLSTKSFFSDLNLLMKCTKTELNSKNVLPHIEKIIFVTNNLIISALKKLSQVEENLNNEDLRHINEQYLYGNLDKYEENKNYCVFMAKPWLEEELLIELRRSISILATLIPYNIHLLKYITNIPSNQNIINSSNRTVSQMIDTINKNEETCDILDNILKIVKIIGKIRRSHQFPGFLSSILLFISNLLTSNEISTNCYTILHSIFKEIVFSRPSTPVLKYISVLLRKISFHNEFLTLLCKNSRDYSFRQSKTSFNFTQDTCTFQVLIVLLETYKLNLSFVYDIFSFFNDALRTNCIWFHSQETIRCQCLCRFCTSSINLLYLLMMDFKQNLQILSISDLKKYSSLFQTGLNILNVLTYHYADAILDSFKTHSQNIVWVKNTELLEKHINFDVNQTLIKETLLASICNNDLNEDNNLKINESKTNIKIEEMKL